MCMVSIIHIPLLDPYCNIRGCLMRDERSVGGVV